VQGGEEKDPFPLEIRRREIARGTDKRRFGSVFYL